MKLGFAGELEGTEKLEVLAHTQLVAMGAICLIRRGHSVNRMWLSDLLASNSISRAPVRRLCRPLELLSDTHDVDVFAILLPGLNWLHGTSQRSNDTSSVELNSAIPERIVSLMRHRGQEAYILARMLHHSVTSARYCLKIADPVHLIRVHRNTTIEKFERFAAADG